MRWFLRRFSFEEIENDRSLQLFGALLSLLLVLTPLTWYQVTGPDLSQLFRKNVVCWPWFENCLNYQFGNITQVYITFAVLSLLSAVTGVLFLWPRYLKLAFVGLWCCLILKLIIFNINFKFRGNQHYMEFIISFLFLMIPNKKTSIAWMIALFYVGAALLKFNPEWLSGAALSGRGYFPLQGKWLELGTAFVIHLELCLIWFLFGRAKHHWLFWLTIFTLGIFHAMSWFVVGWWYPAVMFVLLAHFILQKNIELKLPTSNVSKVVLGAFLAFQILPFAYDSQVSLSNEGRYMGLTMIESRSECRGLIIARRGNVIKELPLPTMQGFSRERCEPLIFYHFARLKCRTNPEFFEDPSSSLSWYLLSRNFTDSEYKLSIKAEDFCRDHRSFPFLLPNPWIVRANE